MAGDITNTNLREKRLVIQSQKRDKRAFEQLLDLYENKLIYYIRRMIGESEESYDVLQEIWILVFKKLGTLNAPEAFRVWLYKIAHDVTVSYLRKLKKWPSQIADEVFSTEIDEWNEFEALENVEIVHQTLEQLSPIHREVLTLRFLEDLELSEIANITQCDIGTIKSRLHYAKRSLRKKIEGEEK